MKGKSSFYLGVDFAERHSATVLLGQEGTVLLEETKDFGPMQPEGMVKGAKRVFDQEIFKQRLLDVAAWWEDDIERRLRLLGSRNDIDVHVVMEDIYPGVNPARIQAALRLGGVLMYLIVDQGWGLTIAHPSRWKSDLGYMIRAGIQPKPWAKDAAEQIGYEPKAGQKTNAKQREDLIDAFLIAHWARTKEQADG